ncbi:hypothetical protein H2200_013305 [Cladophialophora chaetospira]|uniref:DUF3500 domain-containing protein n=1 Tax=Cladophialophora chaetospira TaxID=386627 RepID=A0AA38WW17_9EURO|nr:hypothetical protein H2200_013305 [Cladophialophora chaetospira]
MEKIPLRSTNWRDFIPPPDSKRSIELATSNASEWADLRCAEPFMVGWRASWDRLYKEPYKGITTDGKVEPDLFALAKAGGDQGAPTAEMVAAAANILSLAMPEQRQAMMLNIDAHEWRAWMNPEIYISRHGVRLEEVSENVVEAIHALLRASLSEAGYYKAYGCMKVNHFLGEVVNGRKVCNVNSYNFSLFGRPSIIEPWGWQLFGHHFVINCFVLGTQMVVTPVFMGAEPNVIDSGPYEGTELFTDQEQTALKLITSLDEETLSRVRIFKELQGDEYPKERWHPADQRHLGGAFHDNREIPYEGALVTSLSPAQQELIRSLLSLSLNYLPKGALRAKMGEIDSHWSQTYFAWIGHFTREDGFYYKVHSPVVMLEFDHHSGVFLNNALPLPFHIHTLVRTPNGNDYGKDLLRRYEERRSAMVNGH